MNDVRGLVLVMPHGTTPAAVTTNENINFVFLKERWRHSKERKINKSVLQSFPKDTVDLN